MSSENYTPHTEKHSLSDDEQMMHTLADFVSNHKYTKEEVQESYFRICGVIDETKNSDRIDALQSEMEIASKKKLPLNRLKLLIEAVKMQENGIEVYNALIDSLRITDKEKSIMRSIVEKRRNGTLNILSREEGTTLLTFEISISETDKNKIASLLYVELKEGLEKIPQMLPISIAFSEE